MAYETIKFEKEEGFCVITLNRPEAMNSVSTKMGDELGMALEEIENDDDIKVFVITGAPRADGRPCFCAGADLKEGAKTTRDPAQNLLISAQSVGTGENKLPLKAAQIIEGFDRCPKISIAAIDGVCTAGGLETAECCDIILVSETASISDMHLKNIGALGGAASATRLARRVGVAKAIELCCTGEPIDGKEAYRIGFANQVFPPDKLLDGAKELARKIAGMRGATAQFVKLTCKAIYDMGYREAWRYSDTCSAALSFTPDAAEWGPQRWVGRR